MHLQKLLWSEEAERALRCAVVDDGVEDSMYLLSEGVKCGSMELWKINGDSYAVTHVYENILFVRCFAGSGLRDFADKMYRAAQKNKLCAIRFESPEPHTLQLLSDWNIQQIGPETYEARVHPLYKVTQ